MKKLGSKYKWFKISYLEFYFGEYNFRHKTFLYSSHVLVDSIRAFFNSRFSSRKSQTQEKLSKKITHFTIQFRSKNLTLFTNLKSLNIETNMLLLLTNFSANIFLFGVRKNALTINVCIFLYISIRKLLS